MAPNTAHNDVVSWISVGPRPGRDKGGDLQMMVEENAVIVFARRGCFISYVMRRLLQIVGANPTVHEVEENDVDDMAGQLAALDSGAKRGFLQFPAVFIGGRWFGGLERIIATHVKEELTPLLKQAGALCA